MRTSPVTVGRSEASKMVCGVGPVMSKPITWDPATEFAVVIMGDGELRGEIIGGARVADIGPNQAAEFAVTLRAEARRLGIARQALEMVIEVARDAGCTSVWGTIAAQNKDMIGLASRMGFTVRRDPNDFSLVVAEMPL